MVKDQDLFAFGAEYDKINYESFIDWFIQFGPNEHFWKYEPTYLLAHFLFCFGGLATFIHAWIHGGRLLYLWIAVILHGLLVESMCYALPDIDNFWHSQTPIVLFGHRLPIHILFLYSAVIYQTSVAVAKLKLPIWSEPFAVGLCAVLVDIPYDIVSVNYLHWTWHDTDPNIYDRHYWVPWNSYYFHSCFAASFTFWFHFWRRRICRTEKWEVDTFPREMICTILASLMGVPGGVFLITLVYHPLHDIYKLHSEVTFFFVFAMFLLLVWCGDRTARVGMGTNLKRVLGKSNWILFLHLLLHYSLFWLIPIFFNSEDEIAIGLKETIGPCDQWVPVQTAFGMVLQKRKYLCATDYDEQYFDWSCLPDGKPPSENSSWYTACGVPLKNRVETISIITVICIIAATVFGNLHFNSYGDEAFTKISSKKQIKDVKKKNK